jgi:hypothetical protein
MSVSRLSMILRVARLPAAPTLLAGLSLAVSLPPTSARAQLTLDAERYHNHAEMEAFLRDAVATYPRLASVESIGKSYEGRDLWVVALTNRDAGAPETKPAVFIDGCLDSSEAVTCEGTLYSIQQFLLAYGADERITRILDTRTVYIAPRIMPDQTELYHTTPHQARSRSAAPWDEDGDGLEDEDAGDDLDGDGQVLQMRVEDPAGRLKVSEEDLRLMVERASDELEGTFYRVFLEGMDDDGDGEYNEDRHGGVDQNRNFPGNWEPVHIQSGAGPYPMWVQEIRALVEYLEANRHIAAYVNHHCCGGVILRPSTTHGDASLPNEDVELLRLLGAKGLEATGYWLATSVYDWRWPRGSKDTKPGQTWRNTDGELVNDPRGGGGYPAYGGSIEFTYETLGLTSFATEQWRAAWDYDLDGNGEISDTERMAWNDQEFGGERFEEWTPFDHPQLGRVEIGGWRKHGNPPPGKYLRDESERQHAFNVVMAEALPLLKIAGVEVEDLGGRVYRVKAKVRNTGLIPTATEMQKLVERAIPVNATLTANRELEFLHGEAEAEVGHLPGAPHEAREAEWLVRIRGEGAVVFTVTVGAPNAGRDAASLTAG